MGKDKNLINKKFKKQVKKFRMLEKFLEKKEGKEFVKVKKFVRKNIDKWFKIDDFIAVSIGEQNKKVCIHFLILLDKIKNFFKSIDFNGIVKNGLVGENRNI